MRQNITMVRGDTLAFGVEIEGNTQDLATAYFTCKKDIDSDEYLFQKSLEDGIKKEETGENSITYKVRVAPEDTENLEVGKYHYDLQIGLNGDIYTVMIGILDIVWDVTRKES